MVVLAVLPLALCILFETAEHVAYSLAGHRPIYRTAWIACGIGVHLMLLAAWLWLLTVLPLGMALPLRGADYLTIALAGRVLFHEQLTQRSWIGIVAIIGGLALICTRQ